MVEDLVGDETLKSLEKAETYLDLSAQAISKHLKGKVLELGAGTGNLTSRLAFFHEITALDRNATYLSRLKDKVERREIAQKKKALNFQTLQGDLTRSPASRLVAKYDTLLSCQVLEHLEDDLSVLKNYTSCLKPGGKIVLQLPAMPFAFSELDSGLGHFRRYTRRSSEKLLHDAGFTAVSSSYFNFVGLLGWVFAGKIRGRKILPAKELALFNFVAPYALSADILLSKVAGLNVIAVGYRSG